MYAAIWKILPGPRWLKIVEAVVLVVAIVGVAVEYVFPVLAEMMLLSGTTTVDE